MRSSRLYSEISNSLPSVIASNGQAVPPAVAGVDGTLVLRVLLRDRLLEDLLQRYAEALERVRDEGHQTPAIRSARRGRRSRARSGLRPVGAPSSRSASAGRSGDAGATRGAR